MKRTYVYDRANDRMVEVIRDEPRVSVEIMKDVPRYRSMVDGSVIEGRLQHREHLKRHGVREITKQEALAATQRNGIPDFDAAGRKEMLRRQVDAIPEKDFRKMTRQFFSDLNFNRSNLQPKRKD